MSKKNKGEKLHQNSLELVDPEMAVKKKQDVLTKARNKLLNLSEALKSKNLDVSDNTKKAINKSKTQVTLDYFFKHCPTNKVNHIYANTKPQQSKKKSLQKQNSVGAYPIKIEITDENGEFPKNAISRTRPATVCVAALDAPRDTEALALEKPRKKLSFRIPEIMGVGRIDRSNTDNYDSAGIVTKKFDRLSPSRFQKTNQNGSFYRRNSFEDCDLESQAMRVVRTVGQAFEVCHKLSINAPENIDNLDQDEQDTLTQDLLSDRLSDITSDKPKKDLISEGASDRTSLPPDDCSFKDVENNKNSRMQPQLDLLPPPPNTGNRKSTLSTAETYSSPLSDTLPASDSGGGSSSLPPPGGALSAHHELQLMREQLEQQNQQTQAAMAQLQLAREQLAAEQSARLEAQARTHQLLVHNRELLDHIAALVAHLQGGDKPSQEQPPHMTMPQHQPQQTPLPDNYNLGDMSESISVDNSPVLQTYGLSPQGLIENRAITSCLASSPLRKTFNPSGGNIFNFPYPPQQPQVDNASLDAQLLQRLQTLVGYASPPQNPYPYAQSLPYLSPPLYNQTPLMNNNYALQPPPQKKLPASPLLTRNSYSGNGLSSSQLNLTRSSEPRQLPSSQYQAQNTAFQLNLSPGLYHNEQNLNSQYQNQMYSSQKQLAPQNIDQKQSSQHLQRGQQSLRHLRDISPNPQSGSQNDMRQSGFIKPLAQMGTLTTTDSEGRVRVIVPVPSNSVGDTGELLANLRVNDELKPPNGPGIMRSKSEKVPNRSQLMAEVQRTTWARHTTK